MARALEPAAARRTVALLLLAGIVLFGLGLRLHHLDFPSIGYHNMKENHHFFEARSMLDSGDYLRPRIWWKGLDPDGYVHDQLPLLTWLVAATWSVTGVELWAARLLIVLCSLGSIPLLHRLARELGGSETVSLVSAFFFAAAPLAVVFGRNVQAEAPGTFFLLLAYLFYFRWTEQLSWRPWLVFATSFAAAVLFKATFLILALPLLFFVPWRRARRRRARALVQAGVAALALSPLPLWLVLQRRLIPEPSGSVFWKLESGGGAGPLAVFTSGYWETSAGPLATFALENYGVGLLGLAGLGLLWCLVRRRGRLARFCLAYALCLVVFGAALPDHVRGHNYYQMPFVPLVCLLAGIAVDRVGEWLARSSGRPRLRFAALALPLLLLPDLARSADAMWNRIYWGEDLIGEFIQRNSEPGERIFADGFRSQLAGIGWHAQRVYHAGIPDDAERIRRAERELSFRWVVIHGETPRAFERHFDRLRSKPQAWSHIRSHYGIRQVGFRGRSAEEVAPIYLVLERGGRFDPEAMRRTPVLARTYDTKGGPVSVWTVTRRRPTRAPRRGGAAQATGARPTRAGRGVRTSPRRVRGSAGAHRRGPGRRS